MFLAQFVEGMLRKPAIPMSELGKTLPGVMALSKTINETPEIKAYLKTQPESQY